jgi:hypothetical protein
MMLRNINYWFKKIGMLEKVWVKICQKYFLE